MALEWIDSWWEIALLVLVASALVRVFIGTWGVKGELQAIHDRQFFAVNEIVKNLDARLDSHQSEIREQFETVRKEFERLEHELSAMRQKMESL